MPGKRGERCAVPLDDRRHELRDRDDGVGWEHIEDCPQCETHAEAAYQDTRLLERARTAAPQPGKRFLRAMEQARHQWLAVRQDQIFVVAASQLDVGTVRRG